MGTGSQNRRNSPQKEWQYVRARGAVHPSTASLGTVRHPFRALLCYPAPARQRRRIAICQIHRFLLVAQAAPSPGAKRTRHGPSIRRQTVNGNDDRTFRARPCNGWRNTANREPFGFISKSTCTRPSDSIRHAEASPISHVSASLTSGMCPSASKVAANETAFVCPHAMKKIRMSPSCRAPDRM